MQLHLDEQLSSVHLGGMQQALSQQQAQSALYQEMGFEERLQLLLSHELMQREQRKINRLEKQARFRLAGQVGEVMAYVSAINKLNTLGLPVRKP